MGMAKMSLEIRIHKSTSQNCTKSSYELCLVYSRKRPIFPPKPRLPPSDKFFLSAAEEARLRAGQEKKGSRSQRKACLTPPSRGEKGGNGDDEHNQRNNDAGDSNRSGRDCGSPGDNRDDGGDDGGDDRRDNRYESYDVKRTRDDHDIGSASAPFHVNYLSFGKEEEDIRASWRYVRARRGAYHNSKRLENASWRAWMQSKMKLTKVTPESLNWLKDCDVTWLYGPMPTPKIPATSQETTTDSARMTARESINGGTILKSNRAIETQALRDFARRDLKIPIAPTDQRQEVNSKKERRPFIHRVMAAAIKFSTALSHRPRGDSTPAESRPEQRHVSAARSEKHVRFRDVVEQFTVVDENEHGEEGETNDMSSLNADNTDNGFGVTTKPSKANLLPLNDSNNRARLQPATLRHEEDIADKILSPSPVFELQ
ncbi:uncharacterized protein GGS22DRAFT_53404 [Annulohypoxylon maeteangense]|uniref:uncharacterized protein n=1 Tax=Annulohypoxylon maeteangense TaxID=1927788 RepID=UPI00200890B4|nr:uncharacterized protein GGS22DRAFT_53404 [Annulohypoxylon maeteangense]KAI0882001.1 hypothetical protein GGS22DRAFT_53404 [Annulohypoxylon maeteangense]